ncbi:response regulator [Maridesulfovibrio bastinii]|uniref:response regulator n=1 Tax=Maridesulfovibrio bastinii TaxID=47157 RepID=UPI0004000060|nr:response regulator [Maridesulfovibrio bastinii]
MGLSESEIQTDNVRPLKILLAEDSENNVLLVQLFLKKLPYEIDVANDGKEAVDKFLMGKYDLVLMDIEMPVTDGYQATEQIRKYEAENGKERTPIIAVTAHVMAENREKAYKSGCDLFLTKPVKKADLISTIQDFCS